jgi:MarR family transcriptional regulator, transcriptional regulator for hemolysin
MNTTDKTAFGFLVNDVTRLLRKLFDRRAVRFGLTRAQWRALKRISHSEGMSQAELAEQLELEPIAIGRVIDRLENAGFVERRADPTDRRAWRLHLTARAHGVVGDMDKISLQLFREAQKGISAAQMKALMSTLGAMKQNLIGMDDVEKRP